MNALQIMVSVRARLQPMMSQFFQVPRDKGPAAAEAVTDFIIDELIPQMAEQLQGNPELMCECEDPDDQRFCALRRTVAITVNTMLELSYKAANK